jgi:hypothetical protein
VARALLGVEPVARALDRARRRGAPASIEGVAAGLGREAVLAGAAADVLEIRRAAGGRAEAGHLVEALALRVAARPVGRRDGLGVVLAGVATAAAAEGLADAGGGIAELVVVGVAELAIVVVVVAEVEGAAAGERQKRQQCDGTGELLHSS